MTDLRKAAEMALEALKEINKLSVGDKAACLPAEIDCAMEALRQALAQPDLANVGEVGVWGHKREWVGLTHEEWVAVWPLGAESLQCPACQSFDTDREQSEPHRKRKEKAHESN